MKAKEYVEQYMLNIKTSEDAKKQVVKMFNAFVDELDELQKQRNVKTVDGLENIVSELNKKWNVIADQVEKIYQQQIIRRNIIWNMFLSDQNPVRWPPKNE